MVLIELMEMLVKFIISQGVPSMYPYVCMCYTIIYTKQLSLEIFCQFNHHYYHKKELTFFQVYYYYYQYIYYFIVFTNVVYIFVHVNDDGGGNGDNITSDTSNI